MIVSEIIEDAKQVFGTCEEAELYRKINRTTDALSNLAMWDWKTQRMMINTWTTAIGPGGQLTRDTYGWVVLPSFVDTPISINLDGFATFPRDRWFVHHLNGPGQYTSINGWRKFWDDVGECYTIRNIATAITMTAANQNVADAALEIRLFGLDENRKEIYSSDGSQGVALAMNTASTVLFSQITGVYRPLGAGVITLTGSDGNLYGYYYPDEVNPIYRKIRIPKNVRCVMMTYRRTNTDVHAPDDWIEVKNRNAMIMGFQYIYYMDLRNYEEGEKARAEAKRFLSEEQNVHNAQSPVGPQVLNTATMWNDRLTYGTAGSYGGYSWPGP